jgi:hypothetical protein
MDPTQDDVGAKAPYAPPEIIDYGDVGDLTETGSASLGDGGGTYS